MGTYRIQSYCVGCLASLIAVSVCWAQHQVGDGRALDANLQIGAPKANPLGQQPNPNAANNIITGNVPGLSYFHDDVGYRAPGEFQGRLGGDDLFRFRAQSLAVSLPGGYPLTPSQQQPVGVYHSLAGPGVSPVQPGPGYAPQRGTYTSGLGTHGVRPLPAAAPNTVFSFGGINASQAQTGRGQERIGVVTQPDGRVLELRASPLLGVRHRDLQHNPDKNPPTPNQAQPPQTNRPAWAGPHSASASVSPNAWPSVTLGQQIQTLIEPAKPGQPATTLAVDQPTAQQLQQQLFRPLASSDPAPGEDPYLDLLKQVQRGPQPTAQTPPQHDPAPARLEAPNDQQRQYAQALWEAITPTKPHAAPTRNGQADTGSPTPTVAQPWRQLLDQLDYDLPRVSTFAGKKSDHINQIIKQGQDHLYAKRYLDAEDYFRQALLLQPQAPLPRVGLVHAQIGAGMIRSAQLNLLQLLNQHPELIATRYQARLLASDDRLKSARQELEQMIESTQQPQPAILLAYLGYQTNSPQLVKYALDIAAARAPRDPLVALLRQIWIEDHPPSTLPQPQQAKPPHTQPAVGQDKAAGSP